MLTQKDILYKLEELERNDIEHDKKIKPPLAEVYRTERLGERLRLRRSKYRSLNGNIIPLLHLNFKSDILALLMSTGYQIKDQAALYYLSIQVVDWVDVFTRMKYRDIVLDSLRYCQTNKGLQIFDMLSCQTIFTSSPIARRAI